MSQVDTENTMESESSPQRRLENVNTLGEIDQAPLNSPTTSAPSIITISDDSDDEDDSDGVAKKKDGVEIISLNSSGEASNNGNYYQNGTNRQSLDRFNRRLKCKMRRAMNILIRYNGHLSERHISFLEKKKYEMRCGKNIKVVKNMVDRASTTKSERPRSKEQIVRGLETLRRRYIEAIRAAYEIIEIWLFHNVSDCNALNTPGCMEWTIPFVLNDDYIPVVRGMDGEVISNDLDFLIQDMNFSDSESSSCESEISPGENEDTSDLYFNDDEEFHQHPSNNQYYMDNETRNNLRMQNIILQRRKQRLNRRQRLRDRISQLKPGSSAGSDDVFVSNVQKRNEPSSRTDAITPALDDDDDDDDCVILDDLPYQHNSRRIVETNSFSPETATSSSHATNNLSTTPVMRVQRRSRSRTRNQSKPRRFCTVSPPSSRTRIISQEQMRVRSRSPLRGPRSPTRPLVPTITRLSPSQLPRLHSADTIIATDISASTAAATAAGPSHLSQSPPEAFGSTLHRVATDDGGGASAALSQVALTLLELSEQ